MFLTRQIGEIVSAKGLHVISSETHGMAVRGGSINSHLKLGNYVSPLIRFRHADYMISLDPSETLNNMHFLKENGIIVENSSAASEENRFRIDATGIARNLGAVQMENVVILGYSSKMKNFPVSPDDLRSQLSQHPNKSIRTRNLAALEAGIQYST